MKTNVYIDGFNFYHACFKNWDDPACHEFLPHGYKWVDFRALFEASYPNDQIHRIQYCTAMVRWSPQKTARQEVFLRALRSTPRLRVHLGHHEERPKWGRLITSVPCPNNPQCIAGQPLVQVMTREEKGSDVNLATYLLKDAFLRDFEQAIVVSNDSDLASAIHVARVDAKLPIHVLSPALAVAKELRTAATSARCLDKSLIPQCQLPRTITFKDGTAVHKPQDW